MNLTKKKSALWRNRPHICHFCGENLLSFATSTMDHLVPPIAGGSHRQENLALSCRPCNEAKGLLTEEEWYQIPKKVREDLVARYKKIYREVERRKTLRAK